MNCDRCIFLSECNRILLHNNRCNFFLQHSDIDLEIEANVAEKTDVKLNLPTRETWSKN